MNIRPLNFFIFIFGLFLIIQPQAYSQDNTDHAAWGWIRVDGNLDDLSSEESRQTKFPYSIEWHYRLKNDAQDFSQFILRPMLGYNLDENQTLWVGYALITQERQGEIVNEQRMFQMITFKGKVPTTPIMYMASVRLEERTLENHEEFNYRIRQSLRLALPLVENKNFKLSLIFQDEIFLRLNKTQWAGDSGFDQNRLYIGLEHQTKIGNTPISLNVGYMNVYGPTKTTHLINVGVKVNITRARPRKQLNPKH
jgi:hypothetical protein